MTWQGVCINGPWVGRLVAHDAPQLLVSLAHKVRVADLDPTPPMASLLEQVVVETYDCIPVVHNGRLITWVWAVQNDG